jgi:anti-anti-sigma regulatory factor
MPSISPEQDRLTLATCEAVQAQLADAVSRGGAFAVDLSQVVEMDVTGLQLLIAAANAAQAAGAPMTLADEISPAAATAFARAGLDPHALVRPRLATEPHS